jgi:hypothetical protein
MSAQVIGEFATGGADQRFDTVSSTSQLFVDGSGHGLHHFFAIHVTFRAVANGQIKGEVERPEVYPATVL